MKALLQKNGFIHYQSIDPTGEPAQRTMILIDFSLTKQNI